ncbi:MAG: retropepsin-like aspartic protease family protein, partial [Terriglobales bacterium]
DYTNADKTEGSINFVKRSAATASSGGGSDRYSVPFTREGNEVIVQVLVNGKSCPMYFDTGASGIVFSYEQLKRMNIAVPEDATPEMHRGIGGISQGAAFTLSRMVCGPIDKSNVPVSVTEAANMRYPLLGQTFYGDWQYTIDSAKNVIRFVRR